MLRFLRKRATGIMVKGLFFMIIVVFIFWGIGTIRTREEVVAKVGKRKIYVSEYREEQRRLIDFYRNLYGERFDENTLRDLKIEEKALNNLIDRCIILNIGERLNIRVSKKEYLDHLNSIDAFKKEGVFSKERFLDVLRNLKVDPKAYEEREKLFLMLEKTRRILEDLIVSQDEDMVLNELKKQFGSVRLYYASFDPKEYMDKVEVEEKEVDSKIEKERGTFFTPEKYRLRYIIITENSGLKDDKVYFELVKTKDMKSYAARANLKVFETDFLSKKELSERFGEIKDLSWLEELRVKDFSLPVRVGEKSYIFELIEKKGKEPLKEEEMRKVVRERIRYEKAKDYAKKEAMRFIEKENKVFSKTTALLSRKSLDIPGIGRVPDEDRGIFSLDRKENIYKKPVEIGGKFYVFAFMEERLPEKISPEMRFLAHMKIRDEAIRRFLESLRKEERIEIHLKGT